MEGREEFDLNEILELLRANPEALSWTDRRDLVASLTEPIMDRSKAAMELLRLLADDPKPEVRKDVADLLILTPDDDFAKLAAKLAEDTSSFVQKAVARALDRRRRGHTEQQRSRGIEYIETQYAAIEKAYGPLAAERARKIVDKHFDLLVGSTIHDIRGILLPLKTGCAGLAERLNSEDFSRKLALNSLTRMNSRLALLESLIEDMRAYSRAIPTGRRREQIVDVINEARSIAQEELRAGGCDVDSFQLDINVPDDMTVEVARHQMVAAVANVLKNAYQSFDDTEIDSKKIEVRAQIVNGEDVEITITDSGPGICQEDLQDIRRFTHGKTTKKNSGNGFGLPIARKCVHAHGGSLLIDSEEGKGTSVTILLPLERDNDDD